MTKDKIINTVLQGYVMTQVETQNCIFSSNHTQKSMTLRKPGWKNRGVALRWGGAPGRRCTHTPTPSLTLLGGDAGVPLALRPPVGHGLEAAGAYGVASLQGAHVVLGCGTDRPLRLVLPAP